MHSAADRTSPTGKFKSAPLYHSRLVTTTWTVVENVLSCFTPGSITLVSQHAFSMLAYHQLGLLSGTTKPEGPFGAVVTFNLLTSVKWEQLFLYMFHLHVMGGNSSGWLGSS